MYVMFLPTCKYGDSLFRLQSYKLYYPFHIVWYMYMSLEQN